MIRAMICAALLCVASPVQSQQTITYGDLWLSADIIECHVVNGEPVLIVVGWDAEITFGVVGTRNLVELELIASHLLVDRSCFVGFGWGVLYRMSDTFVSFVDMDRTGLISSTHSERFRGVQGATQLFRFGACGNPWVPPYGPCGGPFPGSCTYGANPMSAMMFRVTLR